jgi:hypothetical protein
MKKMIKKIRKKWVRKLKVELEKCSNENKFTWKSFVIEIILKFISKVDISGFQRPQLEDS